MAEKDSKGRFAKGHKKVGGNTKGYTNPAIKELRELTRNFSVENFENFTKMMLQLEPEEYVKAYISLLKFNIPALQSVALDGAGGIKETIEGRLRELSKKET